jgi:hypothetical protein
MVNVGKMVIFWENGDFWGENGDFLGKMVIFWENGEFWGKMVIFGKMRGMGL